MFDCNWRCGIAGYVVKRNVELWTDEQTGKNKQNLLLPIILVPM